MRWGDQLGLCGELDRNEDSSSSSRIDVLPESVAPVSLRVEVGTGEPGTEVAASPLASFFHGLRKRL